MHSARGPPALKRSGITATYPRVANSSHSADLGLVAKHLVDDDHPGPRPRGRRTGEHRLHRTAARERDLNLVRHRRRSSYSESPSSGVLLVQRLLGHKLYRSA